MGPRRAKLPARRQPMGSVSTRFDVLQRSSSRTSGRTLGGRAGIPKKINPCCSTGIPAPRQTPADAFCSWTTLSKTSQMARRMPSAFHCFTHVDPDACLFPQRVFDCCVRKTHAVWVSRHVHIVQKCHEVLTVRHAPMCHLEGFMLTNGIWEWHHGVPLLSTFSPCLLPHLAPSQHGLRK